MLGKIGDISGQRLNNFPFLFFLKDDDYHEENTNDGDRIMKRHYNAFKREMDERNPNENAVNCYLNQEFSSRREWLMKTSAEEKAAKLLKFSLFLRIMLK